MGSKISTVQRFKLLTFTTIHECSTIGSMSGIYTIQLALAIDYLQLYILQYGSFIEPAYNYGKSNVRMWSGSIAETSHLPYIYRTIDP
jgi:hypothetical protein